MLVHTNTTVGELKNCIANLLVWNGISLASFALLYICFRLLFVVVMPPVLPGFSLTVNQEVVKQEENTLLDIPS